MRAIFWIGMMILALLFAPIVYGVLVVHSPPFELELLDELSSRMTKAEVEEILGSPSERYGRKVWIYSRLHSWPLVRIDFDDQERLVSAGYDH